MPSSEPMPTAAQALLRLREGNRRFVERRLKQSQVISDERLAELARQQRPFAVVLGCSDSRVPAEIILDQGLGDLFVIRVAGNIVAPSQIASIEFAASRFGLRLVVVLGHSQCGAILATIEELQLPLEQQSKYLHAIVDRVKPSVQHLLQTDLKRDLNALTAHAVRWNVDMSVSHLRHGSDILEQMIANDGLRIVGAEYSLETGEVTFHDDDLDGSGASVLADISPPRHNA
jgi:carbonic anhydrase